MTIQLTNHIIYKILFHYSILLYGWTRLATHDKYSFKNVVVETTFTLTVFGILLFEGRPVLAPAQWGTGSEKVKFSVKNQKNIRLFLKLLGKWLTYKLRRFQMVFNYFLILFNSFGTRKIEKLDFWDSNNSTNFKHQ